MAPKSKQVKNKKQTGSAQLGTTVQGAGSSGNSGWKYPPATIPGTNGTHTRPDHVLEAEASEACPKL